MTLDTSTLRALRAAGTQGEMDSLRAALHVSERARQQANADAISDRALLAATLRERDEARDEVKRLRAELLDRDARLADLQARYDNNRRTMLALASRCVCGGDK